MTTHYNISLMGANGRPMTVSGYLAADAAAGVYMNLDLNKPAVAASPTDIIVPFPCMIVDIVASENSAAGATPISGEIELVVGGSGIGVMINVRSRGGDNAGRQPLRIPLRAGSQVRFQVVTAINDL